MGSQLDKSAQQEKEATAGDSPDQKPSTPVLGATSSEGPQVDGKRMFLEDLSQEEISSLSGSELDEIHEKARNQVEEDNPDAVSSVLAYKTHSLMKELWEDR
ncbi:hypothetical protein [Salinibacter ruber]|uniref:hypothetical protein n=1 Tax=Salinibacter ruber TaxID=146919 RepID=UPI00216820C5|nr:hypothetical protein [Salinibacter ruber]